LCAVLIGAGCVICAVENASEVKMSVTAMVYLPNPKTVMVLVFDD